MEKKLLASLEKFFPDVNTLETDYLAEVITSTLVEEGVNPDHIQITRLGSARAKVGKDIEKIKLEYNPDDESSDCLRIYVNREGIYDVLPEGVFFFGLEPLDSKDIKKVVSQVKRHRKEELEIRKFFSVFENEIDRTLIQTQLLERRVDRKNIYPDFANVFTAYWPVIRLLSLKQATLFMRIIPIIHRVRGDECKIAKALSLILGLPVHLEPIVKRKSCKGLSELGQSRLGETLILGSDFNNGHYDIRITVNEIPQNRISEFIGNGKSIQILHEMIDMLFAANTEVEIKLNVIRTDGYFILSSDPTIGSRLGIDTYI